MPVAVSDDDFLAKLRADGFELAVREPLVDVEATVKMLELSSRYRLPRRRTYARRRAVLEICKRRGVSPVYVRDEE